MTFSLGKDIHISVTPIGRQFGGASKDYGLRLTTSWGTTGTQYGDPRQSMFWKVNVTFLAWSFRVSIGWKGSPVS